jgi:hypothetical protein
MSIYQEDPVTDLKESGPSALPAQTVRTQIPPPIPSSKVGSQQTADKTAALADAQLFLGLVFAVSLILFLIS